MTQNTTSSTSSIGLPYSYIYSLILVILLSCSVIISVQSNSNSLPTFLFGTPREEFIYCTDSLDNVCTASTQCASLGQTNFSTGNNLYFEAVHQENDTYTLRGGYTIQFPSACNVTCTGNCSCPECTTMKKIDTPVGGSSSPSSAFYFSFFTIIKSTVVTAIILGWTVLS